MRRRRKGNAITKTAADILIDAYQQQDVDLDGVFMDIAVYNARIMAPAHVQNVADLTCRTALSYRGVDHINFPVDAQSMEVGWKEASKRNKPHHTCDAFARRDILRWLQVHSEMAGS